MTVSAPAILSNIASDSVLAEKGDLAVSSLVSDGGYMLPEQTKVFFRRLIDQPTILPMIRTVQMPRPQMNIPRIQFNQRMLRRGRNGFYSGSAAAQAANGGNPTLNAGRALTTAERYAPALTKIEMSTDEFVAQLNLPYEAIEDNIEGGEIDQARFLETIMELMILRTATDLEEMVLLSDTTSTDEYLNAADGVIKRANAQHFVDAAGTPISPTVFKHMLQMLPTPYHRLLGQFKFFASIPQELEYRSAVAQRQTSLGDAVLEGKNPLTVLGLPLLKAALMPASNVLLTIPQNIMLGIWRRIRIETWRDTQNRELVITMTLRVGLQVEEELMLVGAGNLGSPT